MIINHCKEFFIKNYKKLLFFSTFCILISFFIFLNFSSNNIPTIKTPLDPVKVFYYNKASKIHQNSCDNLLYPKINNCFRIEKTLVELTERLSSFIRDDNEIKFFKNCTLLSQNNFNNKYSNNLKNNNIENINFTLHEKVNFPKISNTKLYKIKLGLFFNYDQANNYKNFIKSKDPIFFDKHHFTIERVLHENNKLLYSLFLGNYKTYDETKIITKKVSALNFYYLIEKK